jgi:hypothetical protein
MGGESSDQPAVLHFSEVSTTSTKAIWRKQAAM